MKHLVFELVVILVLLLVNGFFSMAEIAVISANKARLRALARQGDRGAGAALELAEEPNRFLSTVQIGITLVGVLAAAFGGAKFAAALSIPLQEMAWVGKYAEQAAFGVVVVMLTFVTLVLGELVPKRVGLSNPEGIARAVAPFMRRLSRLGGPAVAVLAACTDALLAVFRVRAPSETVATDEEITMLVREGSRAGSFHEKEPEMVKSVLALDTMLTRELMTPRTRIIWISANDSAEIIWHKIVVSGHSVYPVYEKTRDNVLGVASVKAIYANSAAGVPPDPRSLAEKPEFVPATLPASSLLETFQKTGRQFALVLDEFGGIAGLVTLHDIMEAIVGELPSPGDRTKPTALRHGDGTWLVDGMLAIEDFMELVPEFELPPARDRDYQTVAGYVMKHLGRMPAEGESFSCGGHLMQVLDLDGFRIDKLLLLPLRSSPRSGDEGSAGSTPTEEAEASSR